MLTVKTKVSKSNIHGMGLFADQDIYEGTIIWKYQKHSCEIYNLNNFLKFCKKLNHQSIIDLINFSYIKDSMVYHILDEAKFINHSLSPNVSFLDWKTEVASRDIPKGEEILENYLINYDQSDFFNYSHLFEYSKKEELLSAIRGLNANSLVLY